MSDSAKKTTTGTRFGKVTVSGYSLLEPLGEGSTGVVRKAIRESDGREVAIKFVDPRLYPEDPDFDALLTNLGEARRIQHGALAKILDVDTSGDLIYVVSEFVQGLSLERMLAVDGVFPEADALTVAQGLCEVLGLCAELGIAHGNVTLNNVLVDLDGTPRLTDLGLWRPGSPGDLGAEPLFSPHYLAPERFLGQPSDVRADLYALGVCVYRLLTKKFPFTGRTPSELSKQHQGEDVPDPRELAPETSEGAAKLIAWLTARDLGKRYASPAKAETDVVLVLAGQPPLGPGKSSESEKGDTSTALPLLSVGQPPSTVQTRFGPAPFSVRLSSRGVTLGLFEFDTDVATIGRGASSSIQIDNPIVSRRHAEIRRKPDGRIIICALSSTNSTVVDGEQVNGELELDPGGLVVLSDKFHLEVEWDPSAGRPLEPEDRTRLEAPALTEPMAVQSAPAPAAPPRDEFSDYEEPLADELDEAHELDPYADLTKPATAQPGRGARGEGPATSQYRYEAAQAPDTPLRRWTAPRGFVIYVRGDEEVRSFISTVFQVGSSHVCDLRLPKGYSRKAAIISRSSDGYRLFNVGEASGVELNGELVPDQAVLEPGDEIVVCGASLWFEHEKS